jgi:hypothetical protein
LLAYERSGYGTSIGNRCNAVNGKINQEVSRPIRLRRPWRIRTSAVIARLVFSLECARHVAVHTPAEQGRRLRLGR